VGGPANGGGVPADSRFWHDVLTTGWFTAIPSWDPSPGPAAGVRTRELALPAGTLAATRRVAADLGAPPQAVLLAAHLRAHAVLTGSAQVATGVRAEGRRALPCRLRTGGGCWADLVAAAHRYLVGAAAHGAGGLAAAAAELGLPEPLFDTVVDLPGPDAGSQDAPGPAAAAGPADAGPADAGPADAVSSAANGDPADAAGPDASGPDASGPALRVAMAAPTGELVLRLSYRTDVLGDEQAVRVAGYHAAALAHLVTDPRAPYRTQGLLSGAELRLQLHGMAGPHRELPDRRLHELFEERVRAHPDAVAAVHGGQAWTYDELNRRANRIGRALLAAGLRPEDVVAVVSERDLGWLAAVLAVFKAGGVYLPIEPHFPAERVAAMLDRSGCRFALTGTPDPADPSGRRPGPDTALGTRPALRRFDLHRLAAPGQGSDADLAVPVAADQLAYIYFTSGSTGQPKGAMCEHAGMLNHVLAKIEDLRIGPGDAVAQTAPQCFDISLWQLVSALLVGGRTVVVGQDDVLDVARFVARLDAERVSVAQLVPSYLDAVLSYLERRAHPLPHLRCVSATGEELPMDLVRRWFAARPGVKLVNAYGLTETSDDTNHEVMERAPDGDRVPLGRPVRNVRVYVVDENLLPVPLGTPGEIVFSGVCVGRGYVNDPERTRAAFLADPHRPGHRLYRSGDFGRWLPGGRLEFLGRRDAQVKIRGFRIELGEVERRLAEVPGVRGAAAVVTGAGAGAKLVAFYTAAQALPADLLRGALAATLPDYMVPAATIWRAALPLTGNGKVDKRALGRLADEGGSAEAGRRPAPRTATERRLAAAWADLLDVPVEQIGRSDHFFDRGGTSLSAVRLAIRLDRAVSLQDLVRHPVLAELATLIDHGSVAGGARPDPPQ